MTESARAEPAGSKSVQGQVERLAGQSPARVFRRFALMALFAVILGQAAVVTNARPDRLVHGFFGMADMLARAIPPAWDTLPALIWPTIETIDIAIFGTFVGFWLSIPFAIVSARNVTPSKSLYYVVRGIVSFLRAVPELVWALIFVAAVGLGTFAGVLALIFHSVGMLGRLFAEVIEEMDMGPVEAFTLTGANRLQVFTHAVVPGVMPSLLGIALYRFDENLRSSVLLGFVGAGGIGFQLNSAMSMFQYPQVSMIILVILALVITAERGSAVLRRRLVKG